MLKYGNFSGFKYVFEDLKVYFKMLQKNNRCFIP